MTITELKPRGVEIPPPQPISLDAIMPATLAIRAEEAGVKRASMDLRSVFVLAVLAGAFIAFGAIFATTVSAGSIAIAADDGTTSLSGSLPFGLMRLLTGLAFSLGLILVVCAGAELFTGNNLIVMAWASGKVRTRSLLINWLVVFAGNFVGSLGAVCLMLLTEQYRFGGGAVGLAALSVADAKTSLTFVQALTLGIMCNSLVCLASWMCYGARTTVDRVVTVIPPVAAFVAAGFEHCIANMYFIPLGLGIKTTAPQSFWDAINRTATDYPALTLENFFVQNLLPVTLGNIIGGSLMVAAVYWFVYLRKSSNAV